MDSIAAANIRFTDWAPQNDVLGHSALKLFITHAGSNSIHEAAYHGKPVVCIPLLADQFDQAARVGWCTQHTWITWLQYPEMHTALMLAATLLYKLLEPFNRLHDDSAQ